MIKIDENLTIEYGIITKSKEVIFIVLDALLSLYFENDDTKSLESYHRLSKRVCDLYTEAYSYHLKYSLYSDKIKQLK